MRPPLKHQAKLCSLLFALPFLVYFGLCCGALKPHSTRARACDNSFSGLPRCCPFFSAFSLAREVPYADSIVFAPYERLVATAARVGREYASTWAATHGPTLGATLQTMRAEARRALEARLVAISPFLPNSTPLRLSLIHI